MTNLRWSYVWRGIWLYRSRTLLIILSSAIGIFAFGLIIGAAVTLRTELLAGMNFAKLPLSYVFDLRALPLWLLIAIVVSALSSLIPARAAARLSVRETLAYEG